MSQLMLPSCSAARVPDCRSYWRNTAPWSITAQAPSVAWYACRRAASGSHAVPELIRVSETPAAPATGAGAPRATESPGAPCSCCPRTGSGTAGEPAIARRTTDRLMNEGVEGAEGPGGRVRQEEQRNVQLPALPGAGRRRDVTSERLSRHRDGRRERRWSERKVGFHVAGDARDLASVGRVQPNFDAVCHSADEGMWLVTSRFWSNSRTDATPCGGGGPIETMGAAPPQAASAATPSMPYSRRIHIGG